MRKTAIVVTLLALVWLGYLLWPIYTLVKLVRALEAGNAAAVIAHIDFGAVRLSLTDQVVETYLRITGKRVSPLAKGLVRSAGSIADPVVGRIVRPDVFADFLRTGWPKTVVEERPRDAAGLTFDNLGNAWQIFLATDYGIRRFEIGVPTSRPAQQQFRFRFRLRQWRWQLSAIQLPESIQVLLAEALVKSLKSPR